jgi:hypothetical protein
MEMEIEIDEAIRARCSIVQGQNALGMFIGKVPPRGVR